ncbi:MAG: nucleoside-diphosphate kinase [Chloroflexi bacterium RBG_13_52_12]|nr:MAG: nucleoside-diphosphate kinase [Chloroflexi bacterium RBG_13_52_12]
MERSLVLIKPDAMQRGLAGVIIGRLQGEGLKLIGLKMLHMDKAMAERHYAVHKGKSFFNDVIDYITSTPIVAAAFEGEGVVGRIRELMGATDPAKAAPGTIRKDYGLDLQRNSTHASDSPENGEKEIAIFFTKKELFR